MKRSNIVTIMQKEFARFFGDRRMLLMLFLPGILIYVMYSFMGTALGDMFMPDEEYKPVVSVVNAPDWMLQAMENVNFDARVIGDGDVETHKEKIAEQEAELCVVFPPDFDGEVAGYDVMLASSPAPNIEIYYNAVNVNSASAYSKLMSILDMYESSLANKFDINREIEDANLATKEDMTATVISSMLPMLLLIFLYSGCVAVAPESISGEKERGTIATLLVTPLGRAELAIGKILSLAVLSFLTGLISAIATILSLPKMMSSAAASDAIDVGIYSMTDYLMLALVILSTIILLVTAVAVISAFAKTVKEASTAVVPVMVVVMFAGVMGMFASNGEAPLALYLIPLYNSVLSMGGVFSMNYAASAVAMTSISNLVYACIGGFVLTRMFNSEKIMFSS